MTGNLRDSKEQEKPADEKILQAMQKKLSLPVKVGFKPQDGSIKEIKVHPKDEEWSRNIKRGLANLFQISANIKLEEKNGKQFITQHEVRKSSLIIRIACKTVSKSFSSYLQFAHIQ